MPLELVRDWVQEYRPNPLQRSPDERAFLPAALEIIERPASPAGRMIAMTICAAVCFALIWAIFGKMDIIATAQGHVMAVGNTKTIQPMEIGVVKAIHVADGDHVKRGQLLIELDPTQASADRDRYSDQLRRAELELAKQTGLWAAIKSAGNPKLADASLNASPIEIEAAKFAMQAEFDAQAASIGDLSQQIAEKSAEISGAENSVEKYQASLPFVQQQADLREQLLKLQYTNKLAYLQAQQSLVEQQRQIVILGNEKQQAVAQKMALIQKRKQAQDTYRKTVFDDLTKAQQSVAELLDGKIKAQDNLVGKTLRAPIDGTVQELAIHTVGGVVTPAQTLMSIVPKDGGVIVEAKVNNDDVGFVHVEQTAQVKINTFNFTRYGLIAGKVTSVSSDAVSEQPIDGHGKQATATSSPMPPAYIAYVRLDRNWIDTENGKTSLGPGMEVTTEIHTGRRRIIDYLLSPLQRRASESMHER